MCSYEQERKEKGKNCMHIANKEEKVKKKKIAYVTRGDLKYLKNSCELNVSHGVTLKYVGSKKCRKKK